MLYSSLASLGLLGASRASIESYLFGCVAFACRHLRKCQSGLLPVWWTVAFLADGGTETLEAARALIDRVEVHPLLSLAASRGLSCWVSCR